MSLGFPPFTPAVKWLVGITSGFYLLQVLLQHVAAGFYQDLFAATSLIPLFVLKKYWLWQTISYSLLHADLWHILFNMLALWMFGSTLERDWGTRRFLELFYFSVFGAAIVTIILSYLHGLRMDPLTPTIGASGGLYGIFLVYGIIYAEQEIFLMLPPVSIKAKYFVAILIFIAIVTSIAGSNGIGSLAHLGGLLFGYIYVKFVPRYGLTTSLTKGVFGIRNRYHKYKRRQAAKKFEVFMRDHDRNKYFDEHGNFRPPDDDKTNGSSGRGGWVN